VTGETTTAKPATITTAAGDVLAVAGGDGVVLRILELQPEGKRVMPARAFLAGRRIAPGARVARPGAGQPPTAAG
jgi:methionyl-tRNA formyltransferase